MTAPMEIARRVADAVLYEGYLLYPYRASAAKNRVRWQFGVLVPPGFDTTCEHSSSVTECLLERADDAEVRLRLRFLHVRTRLVERAEDGGHRPVAELTVETAGPAGPGTGAADGVPSPGTAGETGREAGPGTAGTGAPGGATTYLSFEEATERETEVAFPVAELLDGERAADVRLPGDRSVEAITGPSGRARGRVVREHLPLHAVVRARAERVAGPYDLVRLRVRVENVTGWDDPDATREQALRRSLISAHLIIGVTGGAFVSLLDPPEWARPAAETCRNERTWPVLVGEPGHRDVLLSSPIILYDYPETAPESPGDMFDATEIDEMLHLRTLTLTEEERRQARATDPRAARLLDMVATLPPELAERLHGAIRHLETPARGGTAPRWGSAADAGAAPWDDVSDAGAAPWDDVSEGGTGPDDGSPGGLRPRDATPPPDPTPGVANPGAAPWDGPGDAFWSDLAAGPGSSPETDAVSVAGVEVARGSRVRLAPGRRRADAHDMFLSGRTARVEAVLTDLDGARHLAVTLDEDPGADLHRSHGRFLYFAPDEVEPLDAAGPADDTAGPGVSGGMPSGPGDPDGSGTGTDARDPRDPRDMRDMGNPREAPERRDAP
ncbi:hypothetical protein [Streptosporangium pseudovulgare]|uniref:Uncharacterized protein n=1 Tax=Streptosporangium pseudovulgare TaxID=35765 RepID=A0ABQ2RGB7_9ACTN|nr:hypothetical protein [Streptosporangium pseudovulgare]GGQ29504.1 hypothetical protein GCM10010140_69630 [Streptosporangium pseudovulgare]